MAVAEEGVISGLEDRGEIEGIQVEEDDLRRLCYRDFKESKSQTTELEVEPSAALAFPYFLDFCYGQDLEIADSASAVALRWLSTYLGNRECYEATKTWIETNLRKRPTTAVSLLEEADVYNDDKMYEAAAKIAGQHLFISTEVLSLPPSLFLQVLGYATSYDGYLSEVVARYLESHNDIGDSDAQALISLLQEKDQIIVSSAAETLLKVALRCNLPEIQARCIDTAATHWKDLLTNKTCTLFQPCDTSSMKTNDEITNSTTTASRKRKKTSPSTQKTVTHHLDDSPIPMSVQNQLLCKTLQIANTDLANTKTALAQAHSDLEKRKIRPYGRTW